MDTYHKWALGALAGIKCHTPDPDPFQEAIFTTLLNMMTASRCRKTTDNGGYKIPDHALDDELRREAIWEMGG